MSKKKSKLQLRQERQERQVALALKALALDNKKKNQRKSESRQSRKPVEDLARYLVKPVDRMRVRNPADFQTRTYSLARQVEELVAHVYVRYPAPRFLMGALLTDEGRKLLGFRPRHKTKLQTALDKWERELFLAAAQGRSVADLLAPHLTRKETHWFLLAPDTFTSQQNLVWAKLVAAGVSREITNVLLPRLTEGDTWSQLGARQAELIQFFASVPKDAKADHVMEALDFAMQMAQEPGFRFKGRTLRSMLKLAKDWHRQNQYGPRGALVHWAREFEPWEHKSRLEHVRAIELNTSWALHAESVRQRHCVFTYRRFCVAGTYRVVALTWMISDLKGNLSEDRRVTLSVAMGPRQVDQALGKCNRSLSQDERRIVRLWASHHGLKISDYIWW